MRPARRAGTDNAHPGAAFFALLLGLLLLVAATASAAGRKEEQSSLQQLKPAVPGIQMKVVGGDRFITLTNKTGKTVLIKGYDDEPYLRFLPTGVVQNNTRSPTKYVNDDRYGLTPVPAQADSKAPPVWKPVSRNGTYQWFDHRTHSMEKGVPAQVKDPGKRTKIFDWTVPMEVGGQPVTAAGTLTWVPASSSSGGSSTGLIVAIVAVVLLAIAVTALLLTRRRRRPAPAGAPAEPAAERTEKEAW
jgi:hypothetical protein